MAPKPSALSNFGQFIAIDSAEKPPSLLLFPAGRGLGGFESEQPQF